MTRRSLFAIVAAAFAPKPKLVLVRPSLSINRIPGFLEAVTAGMREIQRNANRQLSMQAELFTVRKPRRFQ